MEQLMALNQSRKFHFDDNPRVLQHDTKNVVFTSLVRKFEESDFDHKNNKLKCQSRRLIYGHLFKHIDTMTQAR